MILPLPLLLVLAESMSDFSGVARISCASGPVVYAAVQSQDLPEPGFENRWHLVFFPDSPAACVVPQQFQDLWVRTTATSRGSYTIDIPGWALVEIIPGDPAVRAQFRQAALGSETRFKQRITLSQHGDGIRLLIEELR